MQKKYPFKYLDAYTREDKDFYFGRDEEVKQLYEMTFQSDLLLVYGASGTGKTSLIQCGLANCFESHDWLSLTVRRGTNINASLEKALKDKIGDETEFFEEDLENETELAKQIKTLRLKYFKPIYLIFDQFEELYILGSKAEQTEFYKTIKQLLALNQPVKIIITIREEYYGHLYDFEKIVPDIYRKKLRIEPMTSGKVGEILHGINNPEKSLVTLQKGEEEILIQTIFDKLHEENKIGIDLPYLQVLLDKLYLSQTNDEQHKTETALSISALNEIGTIGDILFGLLDGLVSQLETDKNIAPEKSWKMLSHFVTEDGTKEPLSANDLQKQMPEIDKDTLSEILHFFVSKRILRLDENENMYEIAHDALAKQIHTNLSEEDKGRKETKKLINSRLSLNEFFSEKELLKIDTYFTEKELSTKEIEWKKKSEQIIEEQRRKLEKELKKQRKQKRLFRYTSLFLSLFIIASVLFYLWGWRLEYTEYYSNYVKRFGYPVGIGNKMSKAEQESTYLYFKLSRTGYFGNKKRFTRIETYNAYGKPTTNHSEGTYLTTLDDSDDKDKTANALREKLRKVYRWDFVPNANGDIAQEIAYANDGSVVFVFTISREIGRAHV